MFELVAVFGTMFLGIAALELQSIYLARKDKAARGAATFPQSRKHVRATVWSDSVTIVYYSESGRKVTARRFPLSRYGAAIASAKARGYRSL